jgi:hypothetical protein
MTIRILVKFPKNNYQELVKDLESISVRGRAERIRLLAGIGLSALRSEHTKGIAQEVTKQEPLKSEAQGRGFSKLRNSIKNT